MELHMQREAHVVRLSVSRDLPRHRARTACLASTTCQNSSSRGTDLTCVLQRLNIRSDLAGDAVRRGRMRLHAAPPTWPKGLRHLPTCRVTPDGSSSVVSIPIGD